eukprot:1491913-Pleurochrysis_carterae.AAC.1
MPSCPESVSIVHWHRLRDETTRLSARVHRLIVRRAGAISGHYGVVQQARPVRLRRGCAPLARRRRCFGRFHPETFTCTCQPLQSSAPSVSAALAVRARGYQETLAKANGAAVEVLGAMRTVQANTAELREARRFMRQLNHFLRVVVVTVHTQTLVIFAQERNALGPRAAERGGGCTPRVVLGTKAAKVGTRSICIGSVCPNLSTAGSGVITYRV